MARDTSFTVRRRSVTPQQELLKAVRRYSCAALVVAGVLLMFFCPLPRGSFQATHGPATALRSMRAASLVLLAIAAAIGIPFTLILASWFLLLFLACSLQGDSGDTVPAEDPVGLTCELRC